MNVFQKQKVKNNNQRNFQQEQRTYEHGIYAFDEQQYRSKHSQTGESGYQSLDLSHQQKQTQYDNYQSQDDQTQELRMNLITIHQSVVLRRFSDIIKEKVFWLKFWAFRKISNNFGQSGRKISEKDKKNRLKIVLYSQFVKNNSWQQVERIGFEKLKGLILKTEHENSFKSYFFTKYFVNAEYTKLSFAFQAIKQITKRKDTNNHVKFTQNGPDKKQQEEQKLIKFLKQSKKFRAKCIFVTIRNFISKKCFKMAFSIIKSSHDYSKSQGFQNQSRIARIQSRIQSKDARFIKKKVLPHKIIQQNLSRRSICESNTFNLGNINIGNYEVKSVKRRQVQFLGLVNILVHKKMTLHFSHLLSILNQSTSKVPFHHPIDSPPCSQRPDSDLPIIKNIMKTMCYLSQKIPSKQESQRQKQNKKIGLNILVQHLKSLVRQNMSIGFHSIKMLGYWEYKEMEERIKELEEIKKRCLDCFDNSVIDGEMEIE